jgi:hypothetical protein
MAENPLHYSTVKSYHTSAITETKNHKPTHPDDTQPVRPENFSISSVGEKAA